MPNPNTPATPATARTRGGTLTEAQYEALRWIDRNGGHTSEWREGGRATRRGPEHWTHLKIGAKTGTILIAKDDWDAVRHLLEPAPFGSGRIHALTDAGRAALATIEQKVARHG